MAAYPKSTLALSKASRGRANANGTTMARAVRRVPARVAASPDRSRAAALAESRGRIAVASETVMIACGTITNSAAEA